LPIHRETDVAAAVAGPSSAIHKISHLPSIVIDVTLPSSYPISARPVISRISANLPDQAANTSWLSRQALATTTNKLGALWEEERDSTGTLVEPAEGVGVLWRWWEWVANGEFLQELGMLQDDTLR
jgi:E3 ubiquitin-protein ligase RNF14